MRLGDLDALKHKFAQITYTRFTADMGQGGFEMFSEKEIEDIIDNAPTIETYTKDDMTREYLKGYNACKDMNERPQGDLISREALKKALEEDMKYGGVKTDEFDKGYDLGIKTAIEMLDNAPSVDINSIIDGLNNEIDDLSENLAWYINERNRLLKERRPQGEWKRLNTIRCNCSNCGFAFDDYGILFNFCPNCGANMKGGADNE